MSKVTVREIKPHEIPLLIDFLYEAIYQPGDNPKVPRTVLQDPMIWTYIDNFGSLPDDVCHVAIVNGLIIGAVWSCPGCSYGKVDATTPELAISIYPEYRNKGIGSILLSSHIAYLSDNGYRQVSLSVAKDNYAVKLYRKIGFEIIEERESDYLMIKKLKGYNRTNHSFCFFVPQSTNSSL